MQHEIWISKKKLPLENSFPLGAFERAAKPERKLADSTTWQRCMYIANNSYKEGRMVRLAAMNQKGGSGKTSAAVNLAAALGEQGHRVLLIDLDPQSSATAWLGFANDERGLLDVFTQNKPLVDLIQLTSEERVSIVPASAWLMLAERELAATSGQGAELKLRTALDALPDMWDMVLMDCPPALGVLTVSALTAAHAVFVPVEASAMALAGLAALEQTLDQVRASLNPGLELAAVLACRVDARTALSREVLDRLRKQYKTRFLKTCIRETVRMREAPSHGVSVLKYAARAAVAEDFRSAAREVWKKAKKIGA
jgi:chromosome partitioning protein